MEPNKPGAAVEDEQEIYDAGDDGGIDLGALFKELAGHAKFLSSVIAGGAILGGAIAFLIPNMYTATAVILPPAKPQSLSSAMLGQLGALAGAAAPSLGLKDPADMYIGILKSRSASDDLISRFKLRSVYEEKSLEDTRHKLSSRASFASGKDSMIKISVEDRDPKRAADLANAYIAELTAQNDRLAVTESAQRRLFFEREVESEKNALASAENTCS